MKWPHVKAPVLPPKTPCPFLARFRASQRSAHKSLFRGSPFAAAVECTCENVSWLVSRGPRPLQWSFPPSLSPPISTRARSSAPAPRAPFKQWCFEQPRVSQLAQAPPRPTDHARKRLSLGQYPLLTGWGVAAFSCICLPKWNSREPVATRSNSCSRMSTSEPRSPPAGPLQCQDGSPNAARLPHAACESPAGRCWSLSRTAAGVPISWAGRLLCSRLPAPRAAGPSGRHLEGCHGRLLGEKIGVRSALELAPEPAPASPCPDMPSI